MKIVVMGGSGLIGKQLVANLRELRHEVVAASPSLGGINSVTGEGLAEALSGAQVVVDVTNSPSFEDIAVLEFFETSTRNLLAAEAAAGVGHHVALSVVGSDGLLESGYFRAKMAQEALIKSSKVPYTLVHSTQFYEYAGNIADVATDWETVRLPSAFVQPISSHDLAAAIVDFAVGAPKYGIVEVAGPERMRMDEFIGRFLSANQDNRQVIVDDNGHYFGARLNELSLVPDDSNARITSTRYEDWLSRSQVLGHS
ncbi:Uncharacterized conserved protein YbjT, contains NAD(P)-binding and DUF2867 domains [Paenibacillus sp. UNC496MF]|uniref:SDR family oxidoreductase n=1 Tax=Paenibacillus sp. UNC496MF TaxID=1502753 RepID=UPI0008F1A991|nr:SDR family oxidoreductase [Paenibacillus sp. UNC496MF]SFJ58585.1 Uncharacterized conserved protein YbjT, contains NAD(P)-binding and DUF2867 domains [Paenibacillus sp. UNC496MF]